MELAIPLIALGGLYITSNQKKEPFKSVNKYTSPNQLSDKYYQIPEDSDKTFTDLAGRKINVKDYSDNMVPFLGKTKNIGTQLNNFNSTEQVLDTNTGSGSLQITKSEVAPLFKPQEHVQWANGAPNQSDFYQSRVNASLSMNNTKPWQEEHVGPGLNKGFTSEGTGGFNAGLEARNSWIDKTVNELRVLTNPKQTFELTNHQGPAQTLVKNLGFEGKVEKHLPDKFYINTPDRYLTTTASEIAPTVRSIQPNPTVHRATTTQSYSGVKTGLVQEQPQHGLYRMDHRQQLQAEGITPATSITQNNLSESMQTYQVLPTNRMNPKESYGGVYGIFQAITTPIVDVLRPTRKEDMVGLTRIGGLGSTVSSATLPNTPVPPTIKEGTLYSPYALGQRPFTAITDGGYQVNEHQPIENQRDTTSVSYMGGSSSMMPQPTSNAAEYNATITSNRSNQGRIAGGNIQSFTPIINQTTTSNRSTMHTSYVGGVGSSISNLPPSVDQYGGSRNPNKYPEVDRNEPSLLDAFKQNPYTHSLHSAA